MTRMTFLVGFSALPSAGEMCIRDRAGSPNGKALSRAGRELELDTIKDKLDPGAKVTTTDANGKVNQVSIPRPVEPEEPVIPGDSSSSSGGGSAGASVQESVFPGLVVTDKDGQRISYTSTQSGNTLTVCVGRLTACLLYTSKSDIAGRAFGSHPRGQGFEAL